MIKDQTRIAHCCRLAAQGSDGARRRGRARSCNMMAAAQGALRGGGLLRRYERQYGDIGLPRRARNFCVPCIGEDNSYFRLYFHAR